jgi:hypothetical protein
MQYQIKEVLNHRRILRLSSHIVDIAQIHAFKLVFVSLNELASPVLPDWAKDHFLS